MMKVLIADDELLVRIGIKSCIEWGKYDMEVAGEAEDGIKAMELIRSLNPDVVLLDIKMPGMSGLDVIREMKKENIICRVVVLSSFDDLDYVKEAMKLGAEDYIHKPRMGSEGILNALLSVKEVIEKEGTGKERGTAENHTVLKHIFLKKLIDGGKVSQGEFAENCKCYDIRLGSTNYCCMVFSVLHLFKVQKRYDTDSNLLQSSIANIMDGILTSEVGAEFVPIDRNIYAIITSSGHTISRHDAMENVNSIINLITDAMDKFLNINISLGISDIKSSISDIKTAYNEGYDALQYRFFTGRRIIRFSDILYSDNHDSLKEAEDITKCLKASLARSDISEFEYDLDKLIELVKYEVCLSEYSIKKLFNNLLFIAKQQQMLSSDMEELSYCETLDETCSIFKKLIQESLPARQSGSYCHITTRIIDFIQKNYDKDITLKLLSKNLNVSPNYISRLFKEETCQTLFEYINEVRINKAQKFLKDADLRINEVGYMVGFKSPAHFDIVFNKFTGVSPTQFREQNKD